MRTVKMTAKRAGTCTNCKAPIRPGQSIFWQRGAGAHHADCKTAALAATVCTSCKGAGSSWNGVPCRSCDGTGSAKVQDFARAGGHKKPAQDDPGYIEGGNMIDVDRLYEDDCARRCGL